MVNDSLSRIGKLERNDSSHTIHPFSMRFNLDLSINVAAQWQLSQRTKMASLALRLVSLLVEARTFDEEGAVLSVELFMLIQIQKF
jgi:hypothetical protein